MLDLHKNGTGYNSHLDVTCVMLLGLSAHRRTTGMHTHLFSLAVRECRHALLQLVKCTNANRFACSLMSVRQRRVHTAAAVVSRCESPSGVNMRERMRGGDLAFENQKCFSSLWLWATISPRARCKRATVERSGSSIAPSESPCVFKLAASKAPL